MTGSVQRVMLSEAVSDAIAQTGPNEAFRVMEEAYEIQEREQRPMTLEEALRSIRTIAASIEELYRERGA